MALGQKKRQLQKPGLYKTEVSLIALLMCIFLGDSMLLVTSEKKTDRDHLLLVSSTLLSQWYMILCVGFILLWWQAFGEFNI